MSDQSDQHVLILGAGQAGAQCAASLRRDGWTGGITLAGEETHPPYQRPPLSKAYLSGDIDADRLWLQTPETWNEQKVDLRLGTTAEAIDRDAKTVEFSNGESVTWDKLVIATGARVRQLPVPGADLEGVRYLRNIADVDALKADFTPKRRIAVIGGGYIGLEAAAVAKKMGADPIVIEATDRLLARVAHPLLSQAILDLHRRHDVDVRLGVGVSAIRGNGGKASTVALDNGDEIPCDSVLVGIGVLPNQELAQAAGLPTGNGIKVDEFCRTSDPDIFAIGDCAEGINSVFPRRIRLESVPNAIEHGKRASAAICGRPAPKAETPWFWSDQFDAKLQIAGLVDGADRAVIRGDLTADSFAIFHFAGDFLIAADAVNDPQSFMAAKMMIAAGATPDPDALSDLQIPVRDIMKSAMAVTS